MDKRGVGHSDAMAYSAKHGFEVGWLIKHCDKYGIGIVMQNSWYRAYKKYFNNSPLSKIYFVDCLMYFKYARFWFPCGKDAPECYQIATELCLHVGEKMK